VENNNNTDSFTFLGGSFLVILKYTVESEHLNKAAYLLAEKLRLTYKISRGTGKYAGISGSGTAPSRAWRSSPANPMAHGPRARHRSPSKSSPTPRAR
jgi:hypothetical protein